MSSQGSDYSLDQVEGMIGRLENAADLTQDVIENAASEEVIEELVRTYKIDKTHDGERGIGRVRRTILESELVSKEIKKLVGTRGDPTKEFDVLVPDEIYNDAIAAIRSGKPVVLYGPTGTGKTTFAKQLALQESIGYTLHTATPSWTAKDIIGGIEPVYSEDSISYRTELGYVTEAVKRAKDFNIQYSVILDEITRADISKIFGPLYTSIENPHQTIIETEEGEAIELDPKVNIIATMNMSDRTVNELDNAITRRFAMIELSEYTDEGRRRLFENWTTKYLSDVSWVDTGQLEEFLYTDHQRLNNGREGKDRVMQFGPMHYEDVIQFIRSADGIYTDSDIAVGRAYRTYILPRLLNTATYPQIEQILEHYRELDEEFTYDLMPAIELAAGQLEAKQQTLGSRA